MENKMTELIIKFIEPALNYLLTKINEEEYFVIYIIFVMVLILLIFIISITGLISSRITAKIEQKKNNEERKKKQIENYQKLCEFKTKYDTNLKIIQIAADDLIKAFEENINNKIKLKIQEYQELIFNELLESFTHFQEIYEIIYEKEHKRFVSLYKYEYKILFIAIIELMKIINDKELLKKIEMPIYKINKYAINGIYNNMTKHFGFRNIFIKYNIWFLRQKLLNLSG
jgi:hypothetical protein